MTWLVGEKVVAADAGVIERDIKLSEVLNRLVEGEAEVLGFRDITVTECGAATLCSVAEVAYPQAITDGLQDKLTC
jgi:hypothetical protein